MGEKKILGKDDRRKVGTIERRKKTRGKFTIKLGWGGGTGQKWGGRRKVK